MFAAFLIGESMLPLISDRSWGFFKRPQGGTHSGDFVIVEDRTNTAYNQYTLKRYTSEIAQTGEGSWSHKAIVLQPLNREHEPIVLNSANDYRIVGVFVEQVKSVTRVLPLRYEACDAEEN